MVETRSGVRCSRGWEWCVGGMVGTENDLDEIKL